MNEIVKYNNDLNRLSFKGFTKIDMNMFMALCAKTKDEGTKEIVMTFSNIKSLINYTSTDKQDFIRDLKRMNKKLMSVNCEIIVQKEVLMFVLFPTFRINAEDELLTVSVNEEFAWILNEITRYTRFELQEFVGLDSLYAKNIYRMLKQFRTVGLVYINDIADFRDKSGCPEKYTTKHFNEKILKPSMASLQNCFKNLSCEYIYAKKKGKPLIGYKITFEPEKKSEEAVSQAVKNNGDNLSAVQGKRKAAKNRFNDFPQREYGGEEMRNMEQILLQKARVS